MKYYIVPATLAEKLGVKEIRFGDNERGYLVNQSDFAVISVEEAIKEGAKEVTLSERIKFLKD